MRGLIPVFCLVSFVALRNSSCFSGVRVNPVGKWGLIVLSARNLSNQKQNKNSFPVVEMER